MRTIIIAMHQRPATGPDGLVKNPTRQTARSAKQMMVPMRPGFFPRLAVGSSVPEEWEGAPVPAVGCWSKSWGFLQKYRT